MRLEFIGILLVTQVGLAQENTVQSTVFLSNATSVRGLSERTFLRNVPVPTLVNESEANFRFKADFGSRSSAQGDLSQHLWYGSRYRLIDAQGNEKKGAPQRREALRIQVNEFYSTHQFSENFQISAGKKRVVWGSGAAVNPGDVLNPPKSSNDPNLIREGAWLAQADWSSDLAQVSVVGAADVRNDEQGLPRQILHFSRSPGDEGDMHFLTAAKVYVLAQETDFVAAVISSHKYGDDLRRNLKAMGSFSRVIANVCEVHGEALAYKPESRLVTRFVLGGRYMKWETVSVSAEWYHQTDGLSRGRFSETVRATSGIPQQAPPSSPFLSRDYLIASAAFTDFGHEDLSLTLSTTNSLMDGSGSYSSNLNWSARESVELNLTAGGSYAPHRTWGVDDGKGRRVVESDRNPVLGQVAFEVKVFF